MTKSRSSRMTLVCRSLAALAAVAAVMATAASAATPAIEGVWTFSGGTVTVAPNQSGQLVGTVSSPTTFVNCAHPVGETMWTDLQPAANGSYTGMHQWYHGSGADCRAVPDLGPTAFRVQTRSDGSTVLVVCFNRPGTTAPSIAPDGTPVNVNFGCTDSAAVSGVPTSAPNFAQTITLPPADTNVCGSLRRFLIHIHEPKYDPFVHLTVYLGKHVFKVMRHGQEITAVINLRGLPLGTYTIRIRARTAAGFHIRGSRTYHTCIPKIPTG